MHHLAVYATVKGRRTLRAIYPTTNAPGLANLVLILLRQPGLSRILILPHV